MEFLVFRNVEKQPWLQLLLRCLQSYLLDFFLSLSLRLCISFHPIRLFVHLFVCLFVCEFTLLASICTSSSSIFPFVHFIKISI